MLIFPSRKLFLKRSITFGEIKVKVGLAKHFPVSWSQGGRMMGDNYKGHFLTISHSFISSAMRPEWQWPCHYFLYFSDTTGYTRMCVATWSGVGATSASWLSGFLGADSLLSPFQSICYYYRRFLLWTYTIRSKKAKNSRKKLKTQENNSIFQHFWSDFGSHL